jgi:diaminopimelate decarboxylase
LNISQIIEKVGTPCYVYDADLIRARHKDLTNALPQGKTRLFYAMKALSNQKILKVMRELGTGVDTVSLFEIRMALEAGFEPNQIIFTPNLVDFSELERAVEIGVGINIENLSNLEKFGIRYCASVPCCIRFNPHIALENNKESSLGWYEQSKFGIPYAQFDKILAVVSKYEIQVEGLHIHSSHVIMRDDILRRSAQLMLEAAKEFPTLRYLDFGGGLNPKPRKIEATDIGKVGYQLSQLLIEFEQETNREIHLRFEPGRYLVSEAGTLYVQVKVLKKNREVTFAGVDSGFNHLIRPMLYGSSHEIENISNPDGAHQAYNIVGNLCEADDFAKQYRLPELREGDILAIKDTGAYGFSMSSQYNARPRPPEVLVNDGPPLLIRTREEYADLMSNQVEIRL